MNDKVIDLPSVRLLHATGVDINAKDEHGTTPLHDACSKGNLETVKPLIILRAIHPGIIFSITELVIFRIFSILLSIRSILAS